MSAGVPVRGPWSFDPDTNDITLQGCPIFRVYRESDFPCIEDEDRAEADEEYVSRAHAVVALLNTMEMIPNVSGEIDQIAAEVRIMASSQQLLESLEEIVPFADDMTESGRQAIARAYAVIGQLRGHQ